MRNLLFISVILILILAILGNEITASNKRTLPSVNIKNLRGEVVNVKNLHNDG